MIYKPSLIVTQFTHHKDARYLIVRPVGLDPGHPSKVFDKTEQTEASINLYRQIQQLKALHE